jgi:hypothetical protein
MRHKFATAIQYATGGSESEAYTWAVNVANADGQSLETGVVSAVETFVAGVKADGDWDKIKQCLILRGPRTRDGAIVELIGNYGPSIPSTGPNFERLKGTFVPPEGFNSFSDEWRVDLGFPNNGGVSKTNNHFCIYTTTAEANASDRHIAGAGISNERNGLLFLERAGGAVLGNSYAYASRLCNGPLENKLLLVNRLDAAGFVIYNGATSAFHTAVVNSQTASSNLNLHHSTGTLRRKSLLGIGFYSVGDAFSDPTMYKARVDTLMADIADALS